MESLFGKNIYEEYASKVLQAKYIDEDPLSIAEVARSLTESFGRTYHAVALDIEGTIRVEGKDDIPENILKSIVKVVDAGAYVLFLTGSGRTTVFQILSQIKNVLSEYPCYYRNVYAIDGNGCRLFQFNKSGDFTEKEIVKPIKDKIMHDNYQQVLANAQKDLSDYFTIEEKNCGLRLISHEDRQGQDLLPTVKQWYRKNAIYYKKIGIKIASSHWRGKQTFDISHTDKDYALAWFYTEYDFLDVPILRVGDQGEENGNDYTLLDSPFGFSVGNLSKSITKCFPVYNFEEKRLLKGIEGTCYLLNKLSWRHRLTIPSPLVYELSHEYNITCESLRNQAEINFDNAFQIWARYVEGIFPKEVIKNCKDTNFANVYDHKSGGIRLSDKEWDSLKDSTIKIEKFFTERNDNLDIKEYPGFLRSIYTNTGILLRGPRYYVGLSTKEPSPQQAIELLHENIEMQNIIQELDLIKKISTPSRSQFVDWKLNLALLDNFRNNSLLLYNMLFQAASLNTSSRPYWKRQLSHFQSYLGASINLYYSMLMANKEQYYAAIFELSESLDAFYDLRRNIKLLYKFLEGNDVKKDKIVRKWREVDHPGQIFTAFKSIETDLSKLLEKNSRVTVFGLMYGGIELPFALKSCYKGENEANLKVSEIMGISFYGRERGSTIMTQYSRGVLESAIPSAERLEDVISEDGIAIILDDNIMTGRTIELARDRLLAYGTKVPFCVCIRFPPGNRVPQMEMRKHGGVNPSALGDDIKGLIGQSPYSRIFTNAKGYRDAVGIFDLSRERIIKYLKKNGPNIQDDL